MNVLALSDQKIEDVTQSAPIDSDKKVTPKEDRKPKKEKAVEKPKVPKES